MIDPGDLRGAAILSGIFLSLLAAAELWRRFGNPEAEWTRKLVHLGGGMACLCFPFLVRSPWVVLASSLAGALVLGALACSFTALIPWFVQRSVPLVSLVTVLGVVMSLSVVNAALELRHPEAQRSREWTAARFLLSFAAAGAVLAFQMLGVASKWDPSRVLRGWGG